MFSEAFFLNLLIYLFHLRIICSDVSKIRSLRISYQVTRRLSPDRLWGRLDLLVFLHEVIINDLKFLLFVRELYFLVKLIDYLIGCLDVLRYSFHCLSLLISKWRFVIFIPIVVLFLDIVIIKLKVKILLIVLLD